MKNNASRTLLISFHFPPITTVGGLRPYSFAKKLKEKGHDVTVVTSAAGAKDVSFTPVSVESDLSLFRMIYVPDPLQALRKVGRERVYSGKSARKNKVHLSNTLKSKLPVLDLWFVWSWLVILRLFYLRLRGESFDFIVSSSPPLSAHRIVFWAKRFFPRSKWTADFRDVDGQYGEFAQGKHFLGNRKRTQFYRETSQVADEILCVSETQKTLLREHAFAPDSKIHVLFNGYAFKTLPPEAKDIQSLLLYTGSYFLDLYDLSLLNHAYASFDRELLPLKIVFRGGMPEQNRLQVLSTYPAIAPHTEFRPACKQENLLSELREARALLLVDSKNSFGIMQTKTFDYFYSRRPIVFLAEQNTVPSDLEKLVCQGSRNFVCKTPDDLREALGKLASNEGESEYPEGFVESFSRDQQAELFFKILSQ